MKYLALPALFGASVLFDATLHRWPRFPGATAAQVAVGVGYTLSVAAWLAGPRRTFPRRLAWLLAAFIAAGVPMIAGDISRTWKTR